MPYPGYPMTWQALLGQAPPIEDQEPFLGDPEWWRKPPLPIQARAKPLPLPPPPVRPDYPDTGGPQDWSILQPQPAGPSPGMVPAPPFRSMQPGPAIAPGILEAIQAKRQLLGRPEGSPTGGMIGPPGIGEEEAVRFKPAPPVPIDDREQRLQRLTSMRDIAEGLGKIRAVTGAQIRAGTYPGNQQPYIAEDIRDKIGRVEEEIPSSVVSTLREQGINVPERLSREDLKSIGGLLTAKQRMETQAEAHADLQSQRQNQIKLSIINRFNSSTDISQARQAQRASRSALAALRSGSATGDLAAVTLSARASGDQRLSNEDIQRRLRRFGLKNTIEDLSSLWLAGRLSKEQRDELDMVLERYDEAAQEFIQERATEYSSQYEKAFPAVFPSGELADVLKGDVLINAGKIDVEVDGDTWTVPAASWEAIKAKHPQAKKVTNP